MCNLFELLPAARRILESGRDTPELRARLREAGFRMETGAIDTWLDDYTPCVMLENGRCSIYDYRPIRCRTYWVFSPASECQPPSGKQVKYANYTAATAASLSFARQAHQAMGLKETRMRVLMGSLPRVLLTILEAMDPGANFQEHIRLSAWPTADNLGDWIGGIIPEPASSSSSSGATGRRLSSIPLTIALVGCGKRKAATESNLPAASLYTGVPFRLAIAHALETADDVHILSALHGLLAPHERIAPYDMVMTQLRISEQSDWGRRVVADLKEHYLLTPLHIVFYAGMHYIRPILQWIGPELGYWTYENPLEGMDLFERIRWFKEQEHARSVQEG